LYMKQPPHTPAICFLTASVEAQSARRLLRTNLPEEVHLRNIVPDTRVHLCDRSSDVAKHFSYDAQWKQSQQRYGRDGKREKVQLHCAPLDGLASFAKYSMSRFSKSEARKYAAARESACTRYRPGSTSELCLHRAQVRRLHLLALKLGW
jgi:hypothetical protein